jgi:teichuronic acid biosynthesis glycosyltransferase TuaC
VIIKKLSGCLFQPLKPPRIYKLFIFTVSCSLFTVSYYLSNELHYRQVKILIVCSGNAGRISPFIQEQVSSLRKSGIEIDFFLIEGKGFRGYFRNLARLKNLTRHPGYDIIHAHYGLSGLLANMQRKIPVITTFHGSDINDRRILPFSVLTAICSKHNIFVSDKLAVKFFIKVPYSVIPCGIDPDIFFPMDKNAARKKMNLPVTDKIVLFSGSFTNKVKNHPLARTAVDLPDIVNLMELKGYSREEVNLLLNACDVALLTSFSEGSPQFIKEAMACNRPVVATNVGDIEWLFGDEPGHYLCGFDALEVAEKIKLALNFAKPSTNGRARIVKLGLDSASVAGRIIKIYNQVLSETKIGTVTK